MIRISQLYKWTHKILEKALPQGVRFCIQTRSPLVEQDFALIKEYPDKVRVQVSIATMNSELSRIIETRVVPPQSRLFFGKAKGLGLRTGVIIAPVFPKVERLERGIFFGNRCQDILMDVCIIVQGLSEICPDYIFGESLHRRGSNLRYIERALGQTLDLKGFDKIAENIFLDELSNHQLKGIWWKEE